MRPYRQGADAYWNYEAQENNPYDEDTDAYSQWEDGYIDARALDNGDDLDENDTHPARCFK